MANALNDLQREFQDYILGRDTCALAQIESTAQLSAERRLAIYFNAYRARLAEVLADTYERVVLYIGEERFDTAAQAYIEMTPSMARSVRHYGLTLPSFLADYFPNDPEVAELAAMDQRLRDTFDGLDAPVLSVADVAAIAPQAWENLVLTPHPTTSFLTFRWNTPVIWQSLSAQQAPPRAETLALPQTWLFWRKNLQPHFRSLDDAEHTALAAMAEGLAFENICQSLATAYPEIDIPMQSAAWLRRWLNEGLLSGLS